MHRTESLQKIIKICILTFLCSEMHSNFAQSDAAEYPFNHFSSNINGTEATLEHAYHQASIRLAIRDDIFGEGHICSGAVIASSVVLTVAQCLHNYKTQKMRHPAELKIVMGTLNRYQRNELTLIYGVTHIYQPKTFNAQTLRDNIAIVMLERDIPRSHPTVKPIAFSIKTIRSGEEGEMFGDVMKESTTYEVTSWLVTEEHNPNTQLMSLNATQISDRQCMRKYGSTYGKDMICIGYKEAQQAAICSQDAGASLIHNDVLLALSSTQSVDCNNMINLNCVTYVDIGHHSQWILERIGDGTNRNSSVWGTLAFLLFTMWTAKRTKWFKLWL